MRTLYESILDADFDISDDQVTYNIWEVLPTKADMKFDSAHSKAFGCNTYDDLRVEPTHRESIDKVLGRIAWWGSGQYELLDPKEDIIKRFKEWLSEMTTDIGKFIVESGELDILIKLCQYNEYNDWCPGIRAMLGDKLFFEVRFTDQLRKRGRPVRMNAV